MAGPGQLGEPTNNVIYGGDLGHDLIYGGGGGDDLYGAGLVSFTGDVWRRDDNLRRVRQ